MDLSSEENVAEMDFLGNMIDLLEKDAIEKLRETIIDSDHRTLNISFFDLFAALMNKYDDLATEDRNGQSLVTIIVELIKNSHMKPKEIYIALMDAYGCVRAPAAVHLLLELLIDLMPHLNSSFLDEIGDDLLPSLLKERLMKELNDEDISREDVMRSCELFIHIFKLSGCTNAELMETLTCEVLSCLPQTSARMTPLIDACFDCYRTLGQNRISSTLLIATSQRRGTPSVPYVYSATYRFEVCLPALTRSLSVRTSSPQNVSLVLEVLEGFIPAIREDSLSRHRISLFMTFFSALLNVCQQAALEGIHERCLRVFVSSLQRFESTAQLLVLRRLIRLIRTEQLKVSFESQTLGWLVDLYRCRIEKYPIFEAELGFLWAELAEIHYVELHEAVHFYTAMLVLAQFQALHRINKELLREVDRHVLEPLQRQLADWTALTTADGANDERMQSLPFLQFSMLQTRNYVNQFLNKVQEDGANVLSKGRSSSQ
uniref:Uncharacterized protein n=1 Tax=Parascaris univalens TaxID=6257 RepID=A0A914ZNB4_PARUN